MTTSKKLRAKARHRKNLSELGRAARLSEQFHGRPARTARVVEEEQAERTVLTDLGRLRELTVLPPDQNKAVALEFTSNVRLACSSDGGQLYFVGGDQRLDLEALKVAKTLPRDHVLVGAVAQIVYHTSKGFHDFHASDYQHDFGEDGGTLPLLCYDTQSKRLYLVGGTYKVKPEGIVN